MTKLTEIRKRIQTVKEQIQPLFVTKVQAYKKLFEGKGGKKEAEIVLADLIKFSNANKTSFNKDLKGEQIALKEAVKQPVLRILEFLKISDNEIKELLNNINKEKK